MQEILYFSLFLLLLTLFISLRIKFKLSIQTNFFFFLKKCLFLTLLKAKKVQAKKNYT